MDLKILELQRRLVSLGYGPLVLDGQYGENTEKAYKLYLDKIDPNTPTFQPPAETKWWQSRAFIGGAATIIVSLLGLVGYQLDVTQFTQVLVALVTFITGGLSLIGTLKRKAPIDTTNINPFKRLHNVSPYDDPRGLFKD
jgi:peptidoglycan hydrolase-like protein with peptidoglycan-binding domain